jgi:alpha-L-fucosidase
LEPWQFYGPSTQRGDSTFLFLLLRPYDSVTVRGVPIRRVRAVREVGSGASLTYRTRASVSDEMFVADPLGEVTIDVPQELLDPFATVLELEITPG